MNLRKWKVSIREKFKILQPRSWRGIYMLLPVVALPFFWHYLAFQPFWFQLACIIPALLYLSLVGWSAWHYFKERIAIVFPRSIYEFLFMVVLLIAFYLLELLILRPWSGLWLLFMPAWLGWALWQRKSGLFYSALLGILMGLASFWGYRLIHLESKLIFHLQARQSQQKARKLHEQSQLHWQDQGRKLATYRLLRGKQVLLQWQRPERLHFHSRSSLEQSLDFPRPGIFLGSFSASSTDPFSQPTIALYQAPLNTNQASLPLLQEQTSQYLNHRQRIGEIQQLSFLGRVQTDLKLPFELKGIVYRYYDLIQATHVQMGLYQLRTPEQKWRLLILEDPPIGFPMHSDLLAVLRSIKIN